MTRGAAQLLAAGSGRSIFALHVSSALAGARDTRVETLYVFGEAEGAASFAELLGSGASLAQAPIDPAGDRWRCPTRAELLRGNRAERRGRTTRPEQGIVQSTTT